MNIKRLFVGVNCFSLVNKTVIFLFVFLFVSVQEMHAKILIADPVFNRPDFIDFRCRAFKKFLLDDYEVLFFNDVDNENMQQQIGQACQGYRASCIRVPQELHNVDPRCSSAPTSFRHGEVLTCIFENYGFCLDDIMVLFDSDMFLIQPISIREYLSENDLNAWNGAILTHFGIFNIPKLLLKDFQAIKFRARYLSDEEFRDVGRDATIEYIAPHRDLNIKQTDIIWGLHRKAYCDLNLDLSIDHIVALEERGYSSLEIRLITSLYEVWERHGNSGKVCMDCDIAFYDKNLILDYKHGSGWHNPDANFQEAKNRIVTDFFKLNNNIYF